MEKITCFSRSAYALIQRGIYLLIFGLLMTASTGVFAHLGYDPTVPTFNITIDEEEECDDIFDISPSGTCRTDVLIAKSNCTQLNEIFLEGTCSSLLRGGAEAERQIISDKNGTIISDDEIMRVDDMIILTGIYPPDLIIPCLGDTSPAATGWASGFDFCGSEIIVTYFDIVTKTRCAAEYTVERVWEISDTCKNVVSDTQIIKVDCIEKIGLAKTVYDINPPSSNIRGNFNATFELTFANDGNVKLTDLQLKDNVKLAFKYNFVGVTPGGEPEIIFSNADTSPTLNPGFDAQSDINIFDGITGCLSPGQIITVRFTVEINPQIPGTPKKRLNQATVSAIGPCLLPVSDDSDTGLDPLGVNPGELGDTGGSDDPTVLPLECIGPGAPAMSCNKHVNISLDENCSLDFPASVILEGEDYICDIFFEVMITDHRGNIVPTPIPGHLKGETLYVKVIDAIFGNSCWGTILVEDKFSPTIICENDTIYCNALDSVPPPVFYDNCDPNPVLRLVRTIKDDFSCDSNYIKRVTRQWQAEDDAGNKSICNQVIMLRRVPVDSIHYPKDFTLTNNCALKCNGVYPLDSLGHPSPSWTGSPYIDSVPLYPYNLWCNVSVDYTDRILKHGPCVKKIMRLWRVVEWHCTSSSYREVPQIIHIIDDEPPLITCPTIDYVTTNGGYECEADVYLPPATVYDSCSFDSVSVDIIYPGGILKNQNGGTIVLPFGIHRIKYVAYDKCYNSSECFVDVVVEDHTPPVTICDGFTTVGLNEYGEARLYAHTLDDGTYDDCYLDSFAVRRMDLGANCGFPDTLFRSYIRFCCDDVDSNIMVVFRAWDKAGNYNDCMVEVTIQDKVPPSVYCPPNITVSCEFHFDLDSLSKTFGTVVQDYADRQPIVIDDPHLRADGPLFDGHVLENCDVTIEERVIDSISQCRTGEIYRSFTITDRQGLQTQCYQRITIIDFYPFDSTDITWPLNYEASTCGTKFHPDSLPKGYGRPEINDDFCSLVAMEWEDQIFNFVQDSLVCFKVLRTWRIIDWCDFKYVNNTFLYKRYEYQQIIKVQNVVGPTLTSNCDTIKICTYDVDCEDGFVNLSMTATDDCTPDADLRWSYQIDLDRDGLLDTLASGYGPTVDASGLYPIGKHFIYWNFEDQCGNKTTCRQRFEVVNCKPPTAYCKNGIVVELMPVDTNNDGSPDYGLIDIWANDLDEGSFHPCGNSVVLSFSRDTNDKFRRYDCDSLGMRDVTIYVTDRESGEISSCKTFVEIQDNHNSCTMTLGMITGRLQDQNDEYIDNVEVGISGSFNAKEIFDGAYQYDGLSLSGNYTIEPIKNDNHMNGVSTKDIVILQRYLLGRISIDNPYHLISADVTKDDDISAADILAIRKLILGHYDEFQNNTSWRFVDREYVFQDPSDPLAENFLEAFNVFDMQGNMANVDFIGTKIGDLDASAQANGINGTQTRGVNPFDMDFNQVGNTIKIVALESEEISGLQMTLNWNREGQNLQLVKSGILHIEDQHLGLSQLDEGVIRISWNDQTSIRVNKGDVLFTIEFSQNLNGGLELVNFPIQSEIYNDELETRYLRLGKNDSSNGLTIYQNQPNPFAQSTQIAIESSERLSGTFRVYDASGRSYIEKEIQLDRGINVLEVTHADLNGTGVYYYQVNTLQGSATKKMILMN